MSKEKLTIENIRKYVTQQKVYWSKHCLNRLNKRNISILDIKFAISNAKIIEYYYEDYPYPSCLLLGKDKNNRKIHIVCGIGDKFLWMITAYYPNIDKWENDMETRREDNELFYV